MPDRADQAQASRVDLHERRRRLDQRCLSEDETDLSARYREIQARSRIDRETIEAIDAVRHSV